MMISQMTNFLKNKKEKRLEKNSKIGKDKKTPLNEQLDGLSDLITKLSYGFAALVVVGRLLIYFWETTQWNGHILRHMYSRH